MFHFTRQSRSQGPLSTSYPGSSLYLLPRVLSLSPSQGPLSASFSRPFSNSFPGSSFYLVPRVRFLPPSQTLLYTSFRPRVFSLPPSQGLLSTAFKGPPCIRLARRKFELTNKDSAGGKNHCPDVNVN